jgi:hypothetical protein
MKKPRRAVDADVAVDARPCVRSFGSSRPGCRSTATATRGP